MSDAPITPQFQAKAPLIMGHLIDVLPMSDEDAASALGSFGTETGGFVYREEVGGSGGYGWAMWTGSRRDDMENWCKANGYDPYSESEEDYDAACMAFFIHEVTETWEKRVLTEGGTISGVFYPPLKDCSTLDQKVESFWRLYERPGVPHEDWRREMAHEALRLYRSGEPVQPVQPDEGGDDVPYQRIVISSGHGLKVRGAHGILDEVDEARRVVEHLADELAARGVDVTVFHDDVSTSQNENLNRIVDFHNGCSRDLDVSVHFNAYEQVEKPMGCEVLFVTQSALASEVSKAIASCGFIDRGGKKRTDLFFLNNTEMPSILIEVCFVDSEADADLYGRAFDDICDAIADVLGGEKEGEVPAPEPGPEPEPEPEPEPGAPGRVDIEISGSVVVTINGVRVN